MIWLLLVSVVWAFSFGLIKGRLAGVDSSIVSLARVLFALAVFLPFFRPAAIDRRNALTLCAIGAVQFGLMYVFYIASFKYLKAYEIAMLTIFTPLLVCAAEDVLGRRWHGWPWLAAALATVGAGVILVGSSGTAVEWKGIALMQASNACFAVGQIVYRRWRARHPATMDLHVFAWLCLGAVIATLPGAAPAFGSIADLSREQWLTLAYLGIIASGVCFFLWNFGAARTSPGSLAVANNAKIPLAVACSILVFGEQADVPRLLVGGALVVCAGLLAGWKSRGAGQRLE